MRDLRLSPALAGTVVGACGALVVVGLLGRLRRRSSTRRRPSENDLRLIGDELARIRAAVDAEPNPTRDLAEAFAAMAEVLARYVEQIYEESFLETASGDSLRRLRAYEHRLHEFTAEIRCLRAKT